MAVATKEVVVKDVMELLWIGQALDLQLTALMRSRQKEIAGSEIWVLRGKEIDFLRSLKARFV